MRYCWPAFRLPSVDGVVDLCALSAQLSLQQWPLVMYLSAYPSDVALTRVPLKAGHQVGTRIFQHQSDLRYVGTHRTHTHDTHTRALAHTRTQTNT